VSEGSTKLRVTVFGCCDLDLDPLTLKLDWEMEILKTYLLTEDEVARSSHS